LSTGNQDTWWYNLSSPENWMTRESKITFVLNDDDGIETIGKAVLRLNEKEWYDQIMNATYQLYNGRKLIKVHIIKHHTDPQYKIYFGQKGDGVYPVTVNEE
jgi:hypothetical protein